MYQIDDLIDHKHSGVCRVLDIATISADPNAPLYYVLKPLYGEDKGTVLRIPVTNTVSLSPLLTREEADRLVANWPHADGLYEVDAKRRKQRYESAISSGDVTLFPELLEGIRQKKAKEGHLNSMDQQFFNRAQPIIYGEIATALGIAFEEVDALLHSN